MERRLEARLARRAPGGAAIARDGGIYLTNFGTSAGGGRVVKVVP